MYLKCFPTAPLESRLSTTPSSNSLTDAVAILATYSAAFFIFSPAPTVFANSAPGLLCLDFAFACHFRTSSLDGCCDRINNSFGKLTYLHYLQVPPISDDRPTREDPSLNYMQVDY